MGPFGSICTLSVLLLYMALFYLVPNYSIAWGVEGELPGTSSRTSL